MKRYLQNLTFIAKCAIIFIVLLDFNYHAWGQTTSSTINIISDSPINLPNKLSVNQGGKTYSIIDLKFVVSGKKPKNFINAKLTIKDYSGLNPVFGTVAPNSGTITIPIDKSYFKGSKNGDTVIKPISINYNTPTDKGSAYISVNDKPQYLRIDFNKPSDKLQDISLSKSDTSFSLDTIKPNSANHFTVNLKFKLTKGVKKEVPLEVTIKPLQPLQNLKLSDDDQPITYKVKIDSDAWDSKNDTIVSIPVSLFIQQTALSTIEQDLIIRVKGMEGRYIVKLMPFKTKPKTAAIKLISSGNAQIISGSSKVGITRDYISTGSSPIDTITIRVKLHGQYDPDHNQLVFAFIDSTLSKHYQIMENPITLTQEEWAKGGGDTTPKATKQNNSGSKTNIGGNIKDKSSEPKDNKNTTGNASKDTSKPKKDTLLLSIRLHIKTININDTINNISNMDIVLKGQNQALRGAQPVKVSITDKPFWIEVGTNFDLLDKIKTNNFYAGVYMFSKDIAAFHSPRRITSNGDTGRLNNISFTGGVYEAQSTGVSSTSTAGIVFRTPNSLLRDTGRVTANTSVKSIGILFSPHFKITPGKTESDGFHAFLSGYIEIIWQTVNSTIKYPKGADSVLVSNATESALKNYPYKEAALNYDFRSQYIGGGIPIYIKEKGFNLYINTVMGLTNQRFYISNYHPGQFEDNNIMGSNYLNQLTFNSPKTRWNSFYLFQYRLNEVAYGITFSGEIRGLFIRDSKAVITLALSKKFDLAAILKPVVATFQ